MDTDNSVRVETHALDKELTYKGIVVLTCSTQHPVFESQRYERQMRRINAFYRRRAEAFLRRCETTLYRQAASLLDQAEADGFPFHAYEAMLAYTLTYNQDCALSLYTDRYEYTGGAHGATARSSETWSAERGTRYALRDFLPRGVNGKAFVLEQADRQIAGQIREESNPFFDNPYELASEHFDPRSFYLTPEGLAVYYQQYEIAPYSSGIVTFVLPYEPSGVQQPTCRRKGPGAPG